MFLAYLYQTYFVNYSTYKFFLFFLFILLFFFLLTHWVRRVPVTITFESLKTLFLNYKNILYHASAKK